MWNGIHLHNKYHDWNTVFGIKSIASFMCQRFWKQIGQKVWQFFLVLHPETCIVGRSVRPELKFPKNLDLFGAFSIFSLEKSMKQMRLIDSARGVDAICAAGSWNRFSIRDSVNCQSREQIAKINGSKLSRRKMSPGPPWVSFWN